jgi:hypothetical protein
MRQIAAVILLAGVASAAPADLGAQPSLADARALVRAFHEGRVEVLWARFSPEMRALNKTLDGLRAFQAGVRADLGDEIELIADSFKPVESAYLYRRSARHAIASSPVAVTLVFDAHGVVTGFAVRPEEREAPTRFGGYQPKARLRLPFGPEAEWFVFWGGRTLAQNQHAVVAEQRFAYDLMVRKDGMSHTGDGKRNDQYHCWGLPVRAPADGVVVVAFDLVDDHPPGVLPHERPAGNHVVIDHGNDEFSFLEHLQHGSVAVRRGAHVKAGDVVGRCGNTGHSSEPHLHYQLQNTPQYGHGEGLPAQFVDYLADGEPVARGEPVRGQRLRAK